MRPAKNTPNTSMPGLAQLEIRSACGDWTVVRGAKYAYQMDLIPFGAGDTSRKEPRMRLVGTLHGIADIETVAVEYLENDLWFPFETEKNEKKVLLRFVAMFHWEFADGFDILDRS